MLRNALLLAVFTALGSRAALAHPNEKPAPGSPAASGDLMSADDIPPPPPTYKGNDVAVAEHLGAKIPLDARFRDQDGKVVTLGGLLAAPADVPTILTFNYSDCPMLCSLQLNGLTTALEHFELHPGAQFRIITIDLEPTESLEKLRKMRDKYVARLPADQQASARAGWSFLVAEIPGDGAAIRRVADAVGFSYTYLPERAEWAHPAALIFLSTAGAVTRYVYGLEFPIDIMRESIFKAGLSEGATAVGFMNRCYHYDADANNHAHAGVVALRIGAAGFVVLMISGFGLMHMLRKQTRESKS